MKVYLLVLIFFNLPGSQALIALTTYAEIFGGEFEIRPWLSTVPGLNGSYKFPFYFIRLERNDGEGT